MREIKVLHLTVAAVAMMLAHDDAAAIAAADPKPAYVAQVEARVGVGTTGVRSNGRERNGFGSAPSGSGSGG